MFSIKRTGHSRGECFDTPGMIVKAAIGDGAVSHLCGQWHSTIANNTRHICWLISQDLGGFEENLKHELS